MKKLNKIIKKNKRNKFIMAGIVAAFVLAVSVTVLLNFANWVKAGTTPGTNADGINTDDVYFNGKVYGKDKPFVILEIVPDKALTEISYEIRDTFWDDRATTADDAKSKSIQIPDITEGKATGISEGELSCLIYNWAPLSLVTKNGVSKMIQSQNTFVNAVFTDEEKKLLNGKILVKPVAAKDLTATDIDNATLIYVNNGMHVGDSLTKLYDKYSGNTACKTANGSYVKFDSITNSATKEMGCDLSWEMTWKLYMATKVGGKALIYDQHAMNCSKSSNAYKLGYLIKCLDGDKFVELYASKTNPDGSMTGSEGCTISNKGVFNGITHGSQNTFTTYKDRTEWNDDCMFVPKTVKYTNLGDINKDLAAYGYCLPNYNGMTSYLKGSIFVFNGDTSLDQGLKTTAATTDVVFGGQTVTDFGKVNVTTNGSVIRYLLGGFAHCPSKLKVLEIEPTGNYDYTDKEDAIAALDALGYGTDEFNYLKDWKDYVEFTSISSNGFNGMNKDLAATYDLIIIGSDKGNLITSTGLTYSKLGDQLSVPAVNGITTNLSGNDFTDKAYSNIIKYVNAGMPLIIADDIYNYGSSAASTASVPSATIDPASNVAKLATLSTLDNVASIGNVTNKFNRDAQNFRVFYGKNVLGKKPVVTITSPLNYADTGKYYDKDATTVDQPQFIGQFTGKITGEPNTKYYLKVLIDKNGDGMLDDVSTDDFNEVANKVADYSVTTDANGVADITNLEAGMASNARGYFAWRVIATKDITKPTVKGMCEGSFMIKGTEKIVKVLQIIPRSINPVDATLNLQDNCFTSLFSQAQNVTGLSISVDVCKTDEVESWYNPDSPKYGANNLENYAMVIVGFADEYKRDDLTGDALKALQTFNEEGKSILLTHDTMSYSAPDIAQGKFNKNCTYELTRAFLTTLGMARPADGNSIIRYSSMMCTNYGKYPMYYIDKANNVKMTSELKLSTKATQLNAGQVTQYPFVIDKTVNIAETHAQYYQINLDKMFGTDGKETINKEAVVWYTLNGGSDNTASDYFYTQGGQDAVNNYYIYSIGNVTFSGAGHADIGSSKATDPAVAAKENADRLPERQLFVNTIIKAISAGNAVPVITVKNAVLSSEGYVLNVSGMTAEAASVTFTAVDDDLLVPSSQTDTTGGKFKAGKVYWDVNCNRVYDKDDIILTTYGNGPNDAKLFNAIEYKIPLISYLGKKASAATDAETLKEYYDKNKLILGIVATDSWNVSGTAVVNLNLGNLFYLN